MPLLMKLVKKKSAVLNEETDQHTNKKCMSARLRRQYISIFCHKVFNFVINFSCFIVYFLIFLFNFSFFYFLRRNCLIVSCAVKCLWRNACRTDVYNKTMGHVYTDPVIFRDSRPFQVKSLHDMVWVENHHWACSIFLGEKPKTR